MKVVLFLALAAFAGVASAQTLQKYPDCACPVVTCPVCTHSDGQAFYSEKCGEDGSKTRSCSKPKCLENTGDPKCAKPAAASDEKSSGAVGSSDALGHVVGAVKVVKGSVQITSADGNTKSVGVGEGIHEHDHIVTDKNGSALIEFEGGNKMHIMNDSKLTVQEYDNTDDSKRAVFNLLKGKIRNQVKQKYNGKQSRYEIITTGVVAGVRGTDFIVSQEKTDHVNTRFDTLEGTVYLNERIGEKTLTVHQDQSVTYSVDDVGSSQDGEWGNSPGQGFFNPVKTLSQVEIGLLAKSTDLSGETVSAKTLKKKIEPLICKSPSARLNQCLWHCQGNPKGAKSCLGDKPNVSCVRSRCNANGEWAEATKLPPSLSTECKASGDSVHECDY